MTPSDAWKKRFRIIIECRQCSAQHECQNPDVALQMMPGQFGRLVMVGAPEVCLKCRNLKALGNANEAPVS